MRGKGGGGGILGEAGAGVAIGIAGKTLAANAKARRSRAARTVERARKLETDTVETNETSNRSQLLLSLKLHGFTIESRCKRSGGISGGVAGL